MSKRAPISLVAAAAAMLIGLFACEAYSPEARILVRIPQPPEHWIRAFPDLRFRVLCPGAAGGVNEVEVSSWSDLAPISCWKRGNSPVLAYPLIHADEEGGARSSAVLPPAGGLFPLHLGTGEEAETLALSWSDGFLAALLLRLCERGADMSPIDAGILTDRFRAFADPWDLDGAAIAEKLADGSFRLRDIDLLPSREVTVQPGSGEWFLESPFGTSYRVSAGETLSLGKVSIGMHHLFDVAGRRISLYVTEEETVAISDAYRPMPQSFSLRSHSLPASPRL